MTIKHLVISGGGPLGLRYLNILKLLNEKGYWLHDNIESIYGTSIGAVIGAFIVLNHDWETLFQYIIKRPWQNAFNINAKQILDSYYNKGICDQNVFKIIFEPLLKSKNLSITITLYELYEYSKISLNMFTFDINSFKTIHLNHIHYPNIQLIDALHMTCALPGLFVPFIMENYCCIDGGIMCNFPIHYCIQEYTNHDEILAIKNEYSEQHPSRSLITENTNILEYIMIFTNKSIQYMLNKEFKDIHIQNTVLCKVNENPLTLENITNCLYSEQIREQMIQQGAEDVDNFLTI